MRSTFSGLNTMVRGINANQLSENTVGHNISNANTEGYSRQSVNLAAVRAQKEYSVYGEIQVGKGVDSTSLTRARDIYADRQYWQENSTSEYYKSRQKEYDKIEAIFNDTTNEGVQSAIQEFYKAWSALSASASDSSARITVVEKAKVFADRIHTAAQQMQDQINANYKDMELNVVKINDYTDQIVLLNQKIMEAESTGGMANDLRDQRDLLVDEMSGYVNVNVYESPTGMYSLVSDGVTLVNGVNKLTLAMSDPYVNEEYGVNDYSVILKESGIAYMPSNGKLKAQMDQIAEDKNYIDYLADMSAFMLTTFNHQHQQGVGIDTASTTVDYTASDGSTGTLTVQGSVGQNFYGDRSTIYSWDDATRSVIATAYSGGITSELEVTASTDPSGVTTYKTSANAKGLGTASSPLTMKGINIIKELEVNALLTATDGQNLVAARSWGTTSGTDSSPAAVRTPEVNGTGDGTNAVDMSILFNANQENTSIESDTSTDKRSIGRISLEAYYNQRMTALGSDAETMDSKVISQDEVMTQIEEWRKSVSGVNWNEELTNMIMFQQGYSACSRCLTTMDEMLDRLINSTGVVGR